MAVVMSLRDTGFNSDISSRDRDQLLPNALLQATQCSLIVLTRCIWCLFNLIAAGVLLGSILGALVGKDSSLTGAF